MIRQTLDRQVIVAWSGLALLLACAYLGVVAPWLDRYRENADRIAQLRQQLQLATARAADRPALQDALAALARTPARAGGYLQAADRGSAVQALQQRIADVLASAGTVVAAMSAEDGGYGGDVPNRVSLSVRFQATTVGVRDALLALETGPPTLFVQGLTVTPAPHLPSASPGALSVSLTVNGYFAGAAP